MVNGEINYNLPNSNWDNDFNYFCDYLKEILCSQAIYDNQQKQRIILILDYLKECGSYSFAVNSCKISENDVVIEKIAYTEDNLYDIIADAIGMLQATHSESIPYVKNEKIRR